MEDKERELIFEVAGMAGDILLRSGAEISRVDETMRRIACAYELENVSTFVLSNGIFLTSETEGSNHQVRVRHIPLAGARLDRIDAVNELSREIELGFFTPTEATPRIMMGSSCFLRSCPRSRAGTRFWQPVSEAEPSASSSAGMCWIRWRLSWQALSCICMCWMW